MRKKMVVNGKLSEGGVKYVAQRYAIKLKLTGFAKKHSTNTLVIEVQGTSEAIQEFKELLYKGTQFFEVDSIEEIELTEIEEKTFRIG